MAKNTPTLEERLRKAEADRDHYLVWLAEAQVQIDQLQRGAASRRTARSYVAALCGVATARRLFPPTSPCSRRSRRATGRF